jgi:multidrug efflux pump subunit AcrB
MVDIMVHGTGPVRAEAVELVGKPLETIVKSVDGVEHVYTQAAGQRVMVTARFLVGSNPEDAAIRINEKIERQQGPDPGGHPAPQVTVRGINDVPIVVLTLTPKPGAAGAMERCRRCSNWPGKLRTEIAKVDDVGLTFITGGRHGAARGARSGQARALSACRWAS